MPLLRRRNKGESVPFVHLLRHGAHGDVGRVLTGRAPDGGLTDEGRGQVEAAVRLLQDDPPSAIYASPRRRTAETAAIVAEHFELEVRKAPALDEVDFGRWTGKSFAELEGDPLWHRWNERRADSRCPGGEGMAEAQSRALAFAFEAAARHEGAPLLVTHCDIIRALVCWAERRSLNDIHSTDCPPGSLAQLDLSADMLVNA